MLSRSCKVKAKINNYILYIEEEIINKFLLCMQVKGYEKNAAENLQYKIQGHVYNHSEHEYMFIPSLNLTFITDH